jgi:glutathione reductase (NADPH)
VRDSIPGIEACATSDDLLDLAELPARAAIIGGGFIAVEFASMLARLGVKVELFYRNPLPLRGFDEMLRTAAAAELHAAGVVLHPGSVPSRVQRAGDAFLLLMGESRILEFPWVLNATGRRPNSAGLGLATDDQGAVRIDERLQTNRTNVWAIGDVTNRRNLTPVAIAEGRALADRLFGPGHRPVDLRLVPSAVFMLPPLANSTVVEARRTSSPGMPPIVTVKSSEDTSVVRFKLILSPDMTTGRKSSETPNSLNVTITLPDSSTPPGTGISPPARNPACSVEKTCPNTFGITGS